MIPAIRDCYAVTHPGVEPITAGELASIGLVPGAQEPGGVAFEGDLRAVMAANLHLRTPSRVLVRIGTFRARTFPELERHARRVPWLDYLPSGAAVAFAVTSRKSKLYHQGAIAERLLRVIGESAEGVRPSDDDADAQLFVVRAVRDEFTISVDSSGALLHRRGYRLATGKAPLRETLAAAMLLALGWDGSAPLLDPFCGSGTIPIEAALIARRIPPGHARRFAFERWPGADPAELAHIRASALERALASSPVPILGSDRDAGAIASASANAVRAGVADDIELRQAPLSAIRVPGAPGLLLTNPPYGVRVGERRPLRDLYAQVGNLARRDLAGWEVALLSAHADLAAQARLPYRPIFETTNGGLPVRLIAARV
ncbi:MAG TPA: class I SAM-dependent RNA methyltransferase [Gemmatimonadales bacterium]|nr:class I SAM-dependent RNA methyltransferase [Gemmatimonadales bacterium]